MEETGAGTRGREMVANGCHRIDLTVSVLSDDGGDGHEARACSCAVTQSEGTRIAPIDNILSCSFSMTQTKQIYAQESSSSNG
ncbi:unnamed protein product [Enterobius vermicularis]|uniref:Uncharacterized protein n=1 Tax=Enterobius vermicularis TaxID=51028 RepID=A0A0N4VQ25_ENTVE|nr:unnamed protein product [Enterobius vermicularis]